MSDLRFDDYAEEFLELCATEDGCLGSLADDYGDDYGDDIALPEPLSAEQIAFLQNTTVPDGIKFYINGHLVPPGTAVIDALSDFGNDFGNENDEIDGCPGCC